MSSVAKRNFSHNHYRLDLCLLALDGIVKMPQLNKLFCVSLIALWNKISNLYLQVYDEVQEIGYPSSCSQSIREPKLWFPNSNNNILQRESYKSLDGNEMSMISHRRLINELDNYVTVLSFINHYSTYIILHGSLLHFLTQMKLRLSNKSVNGS